MNRLQLWLCPLLLAFFIAGCGDKPSASSNKSESGDSAKKTKLAFVTNATGDFWIYAQAGIAKAEKEFSDIEVDFKSGDGTTGKQKRIVEDLIVSGVKGIAISPTNAKDQVGMINEWQKSVPIVCIDSDSPESQRTSYLGTDNVAAGRKCGELIKEALPNGGKIMVFVGLRDAQNAIDRFQGIKDALKGTKVEIIDLRTDGADATKARRNAEDTLTKYPDISALVGLWSYNPPAILKAVKAAGKVGKVKIIAFDEDKETLAGIDSGAIYGTVVQNPHDFGYESIKLLRKLTVEGKSAKEAGIPGDTKSIFVDTKVIKKGEGLKYLEYCEGLKNSMKKSS